MSTHSVLFITPSVLKCHTFFLMTNFDNLRKKRIKEIYLNSGMLQFIRGLKELMEVEDEKTLASSFL